MSLIEAHGIALQTHPEVYVPSDDTWLLADALDLREGERLLDVGTGTGAVAVLAARRGARVTATDVNPSALRLCRDNARRNGVHVDVVQADLLRGIRAERFDLVTFNPPYLPTEPDERLPGPLNAAFDGGSEGRDVLSRFLDGLRIGRARRALVVVSSLQGPSEVAAGLSRAGFAAEPVRAARLPYEALTIFSLTPTRSREARV